MHKPEPATLQSIRKPVPERSLSWLVSLSNQSKGVEGRFSDRFLVALLALFLALSPGTAATARAANAAAPLRRPIPEECLIGGQRVPCPVEPEVLSAEDKRARAAARGLVFSDSVDTSSAQQPTSTGWTGPQDYTVQEGDTLWSLSIHFGISVSMIASANGLGPHDFLAPGEVIHLPASNLPGAATMGADGPIVKGSGLHLVASISRQHCWLFQDGLMLGDWTCSTGRESSPSMPGNYTVQSKMTRAYFGPADSWMPYWLGLYDAPGNSENGIHGLPYAADTGEKFWTDMIGTPVTFGCIMLEDAVVQDIWEIAYVGMPVTILR